METGGQQVTDETETSATDWLARYRAAGFRMKVDALSVSPHPDDNVLKAYRDMWSVLRSPENADLRRAVEAEVRQQVETLAAWTD